MYIYNVYLSYIQIHIRIYRLYTDIDTHVLNRNRFRISGTLGFLRKRVERIINKISTINPYIIRRILVQIKLSTPIIDRYSVNKGVNLTI